MEKSVEKMVVVTANYLSNGETEQANRVLASAPAAMFQPVAAGAETRWTDESVVLHHGG